MTEFLTENTRRAYPLAGSWPRGMSIKWNEVLLDASISINRSIRSTERVALLSVKKSSNNITLKIGIQDSDTVSITLGKGTGKNKTVYAKNTVMSVKALVTVNGPVIDEIIDSGDGTDEVAVNNPFALRCVNSATRYVESIDVYSPERGKTPVFTGNEGKAGKLGTVGSDVSLRSDNGIDVEETELLPLSGDIIRISALSSQTTSEESDEYVDISLRGDDCFTVETLPGAKVDASGDIVKRTDEDPGGILYGGVIRIGTKCKPCCQCEDYENAYNMLPNDDALLVKNALDKASALYSNAVAAFNKAKEAELTKINAYTNVRVSSVGTTSGGVYGGSTAIGTRKRIALTTTVTNMTLQLASVRAKREDLFTVPGTSFSAVSISWRTAGSAPRSGTEIPTTNWSLRPGDTLVITGTYAAIGESNDTTIPENTKTTVYVSLPGKTEEKKEEPVR